MANAPVSTGGDQAEPPPLALQPVGGGSDQPGTSCTKRVTYRERSAKSVELLHWDLTNLIHPGQILCVESVRVESIPICEDLRHDMTGEMPCVVWCGEGWG